MGKRSELGSPGIRNIYSEVSQHLRSTSLSTQPSSPAYLVFTVLRLFPFPPIFAPKSLVSMVEGWKPDCGRAALAGNSPLLQLQTRPKTMRSWTQGEEETDPDCLELDYGFLLQIIPIQLQKAWPLSVHRQVG